MMLLPSQRFLFALIAFATLVSAQTQDRLHFGTIEMSIQGGDSVDGLAGVLVSVPGAQNFKVTSSSRGLLAVRTAVAANPSLLFYGQVGVLVGKHNNQTLAGGYTAQTNIVNVLYEGGLEWRIPGGNRRPSPFYVAGAAATFEKRADTLVTYTNPAPLPGQVLTSATSLRVHGAGFAVASGVGFRHNFRGKTKKDDLAPPSSPAEPSRSRFGFNLEFKGYFPTSGILTPIGVATAGIFIDFR